MIRLEAPERASLCELLDELGGDQPTLCEGWRTRDLAAHLVLRESRMVAAAGIVVPALAGHTARLQNRLADGDFGALVRRLRAGPPARSPFRLPGVGEVLNGVEFFVHHEDVRRAQPGWRPRDLDPATNGFFWRRAGRMARVALRDIAGPVVLVRSDTGDQHEVRRAATEPTVLRGMPAELLLYVFGRRDHALVERSA
jgi:uncharacterized protein (TIGR03085 family)